MEYPLRFKSHSAVTTTPHHTPTPAWKKRVIIKIYYLVCSCSPFMNKPNTCITPRIIAEMYVMFASTFSCTKKWKIYMFVVRAKVCTLCSVSVYETLCACPVHTLARTHIRQIVSHIAHILIHLASYSFNPFGFGIRIARESRGFETKI